MPNFQRGNSAGLSALLSLDNGATLRVKVTRWETNQSGQPRARRGRGGIWESVRFTLETGTILIEGTNVNEATAPAPNAWRQINGNIEISVFSGKSITYPVTILSNGYRFDEKKNEMPRVLATAQIIGDPTWAGWASTPTLPVISKQNQEQYEGSGKSVDPKELQSSATRRTDIWGSFSDTDTAESALVAQIIAAAQPPFAGLKLRSATFQRDAIDGGTVLEQWGLNDTQEDIELPNSLTDDDAADLADAQTITLVQGSITPSAPVTPSGLKLVNVQTVKLNDDKFRQTFFYARRDRKDDITMPGSSTSDDASDLADEIVVVEVQASSTATAPSTPSGFVLRETLTSQIHGFGKWRQEFHFARRTRQQGIEFDESQLADDPSDLADTQTITLVQTTSVATATPPSTPSGLKLVEQSSVQIHDASTGARWKNSYKYARRNREDDAEMEGTVYSVDQSGNIVTGSARVAVVESDSTPDGGVSVPGLVLTDIEKKQLHDTKWLITYIFGQSTHEDQIELEGTEYVNDVSNLTDKAAVTLLNNSSTYPASLDTPPTVPTTGTLKLRSVKSRKINTTAGSWAHTATYGLTSEKDDAEFNGSLRVDDQSSTVIAGEARIAVVESDSTPDGGVSYAPLVLRDIEKKQLNDGKWLITYLFAQRTHEQDVLFEGTDYENDPADLTDKAKVTLINASSTYPAALDTPPSSPTTGTLKLRRIISRQHTSGGKWVHTALYGLTSETDDTQFNGSLRIDDQGSVVVAGEARIAVVESDSTPDGGVSYSPLVLRDIEKKQLTDGKWLITYLFAQRTHQQDIEFLQSRSVAEASNLEREPIQVEVTGSSTPGSGSNPDSTNLSLMWTISHQETNSGKWVHAHHFGPLTPDEKLAADYVRDQVDPATLDDNATAAGLEDEFTRASIDTNATAPSPPPVSGKVCFKHWTQRRGKVTYLHVYFYRYRDSVRSLEAEKYRLSTDVSALDSRAVTAKVYAIASVPTTPTAADYSLDTSFVLERYEDFETPNPLFRIRVYSWALVTNKQREEFAVTSAEVDVLSGYTRRTATVVDSSSTPAAFADALLTANKSDSTFRRAIVKSLTPQKLLQIIETSGEDKRIIPGGSTVARYPFRGIPVSALGLYSIPSSAFNNTAALVKVLVLGRSAGGLGFLNIQQDELDRARGSFTLRRVRVTDTPSLYFYPELKKTVCNSPFLGHPTYQVMYAGVKATYTLAIPGARLTLFDYSFLTDDAMFVNDGAILNGRFDNNSAAPFTVSGYYAASLFDSSSLLKWPASNDFSGFLAP